MKKNKFLVLVCIGLLIFISCADDNEFHNLLGSWSDIPSAGTPLLKSNASMPPPIDGCSEKITLKFNENLSGSVSLEEIECEDPTSVIDDFSWSIKGDELRILFDPSIEKDKILDLRIGTFAISGDQLTITNEDGSTIVLNRE